VILATVVVAIVALLVVIFDMESFALKDIFIFLSLLAVVVVMMLL